LEPSAGAGHVADMMAQEIDKHTPGGTLHCVELYRALREVLTLKGHEVIADDFMEMNRALYDVIAMNPPFEKDAAIGHVLKAASMLRPGGLLLAVIPAGLERGGSSAKRASFAEWLEESAEIVGRYDD